MAQQARGFAEINSEECKGCGMCIAACPCKCLFFESHLSAYGVRPASYSGTGCSACSICFYVCPEPGAITVYRIIPPTVPSRIERQKEIEYAPTV